jgi:hypothetical protein
MKEDHSKKRSFFLLFALIWKNEVTSERVENCVPHTYKLSKIFCSKYNWFVFNIYHCIQSTYTRFNNKLTKPYSI